MVTHFKKKNCSSLAIKMEMHLEGQNIFDLVQNRGLTNWFWPERVNSVTNIWPADNIQERCLTRLQKGKQKSLGFQPLINPNFSHTCSDN